MTATKKTTSTRKKSSSRDKAKVTLTKNADGTTTIQKGGEFAGKIPSKQARKAPTVSKIGILTGLIAPSSEGASPTYLDQLTHQAAILVASNRSIGPEVLTALMKHPTIDEINPQLGGWPKLKMAIAENFSTPLEVLSELLYSEEPVPLVIVSRIATHHNTTKEMLSDIYRNSGHPTTVISNPKTSPAIIHSLVSQNPDNNSVLYGAAENPATTDKTLQALALCAESTVRARVANHPNASDELLEFLAGDAEENVYLQAKGSISRRRR